MSELISLKLVVAALAFSAIGIVVLAVALYVFDLLTPGNLWKEIVEEKNVALAITAAATILAVAHIVAAAVHG